MLRMVKEQLAANRPAMETATLVDGHLSSGMKGRITKQVPANSRKPNMDRFRPNRGLSSVRIT